MSIVEREKRAVAYIDKCARRRQRAARRRQRKVQRFMRSATPFASGICLVGVILALV